MRRIAQAEAELYEDQIEERLRRSGYDERQLLEFGARFGDQVIGLLEHAITDIYRRHREHVWIEHSIAARLAASLAALVEDTSRRHGGRSIRWLGDGGMFHFKVPGHAVLAGLDMVEAAPRAGLPPMHIGIHTGPVIFQDGDVYGRTVNRASRIASHATTGQVLTSEETMRRSDIGGIRFAAIEPVSLKGLPQPVSLYQALRAD